jgi:hypothetical protein
MAAIIEQFFISGLPSTFLLDKPNRKGGYHEHHSGGSGKLDREFWFLSEALLG